MLWDEARFVENLSLFTKNHFGSKSRVEFILDYWVQLGKAKWSLRTLAVDIINYIFILCTTRDTTFLSIIYYGSIYNS